MGQRTIYVRDEHEPLWERAKELAAGESLSTIIAEGLQAFIQKQERARESEPVTANRIVLEVLEGSTEIRRTVAFAGRLLGNFEEFEVYETIKRQLLFRHVTGTYKVYHNFEAAAKDPSLAREHYVLSGVAEVLKKEWIEELDI